MKESCDYVIEQILEVTKDKKSLNFWKKAILILGQGRVEEELGEVKDRIRRGEIRTPARYLTRLLKRRMDEVLGQRSGKGNVEAAFEVSEDVERSARLSTFYCDSQEEFINELMSMSGKDDPKIPTGAVPGQMPEPYSKKTVPWITFMGADFFTLSSNKDRSDRVMVEVHTKDGTLAVPMIRGKYFPEDNERGILTANHARVLAAMADIWVDQGCQYVIRQDGVRKCYCKVFVRDLAKRLGWTSFCGQAMTYLKQMIIELKDTPYFLEVGRDEVKGKSKGLGFTLLGDFTLLDMKEKGKDETVFQIYFSDSYSLQLLNRRVVGRSKDMLKTSSEVALLLRLFLEPRLIAYRSFKINLKDLIVELNLPQAYWHKYPSLRKQQFEKAIKQINCTRTGTNEVIRLQISQGKEDHILEANLNEFKLVNA